MTDEPDKPELSPERQAMQKKLDEGRAFAREMAEALNYNVANDVEIEKHMEPRRPKTFEEAFLSRLRQYDQAEADKLAQTEQEEE